MVCPELAKDLGIPESMLYYWGAQKNLILADKIKNIFDDEYSRSGAKRIANGDLAAQETTRSDNPF